MAAVDAVRSPTRPVAPRAHGSGRVLGWDVRARGRAGEVALGSACPGGERIEVRGRDGELVFAVAGCAPAWKPPPDGDLTFVRGGSLVELEEPCRWERADCLRVVLSRRALDDQMRRAWGLTSAGFDLRRVSWLGDDRVAAVVRRRARTGADFVAVFAGSTLVRVAPVLAPCRPKRVPLRYPDGRKIFALRGCWNGGVSATS